jgi:hypothetical protein
MYHWSNYKICIFKQLWPWSFEIASAAAVSVQQHLQATANSQSLTDQALYFNDCYTKHHLDILKLKGPENCIEIMHENVGPSNIRAAPCRQSQGVKNQQHTYGLQRHSKSVAGTAFVSNQAVPFSCGYHSFGVHACWPAIKQIHSI